MISNLKFLEKNIFEIDNLYMVNSYLKTNKNELLAKNFKKVKIVNFYDELYKDFLGLGKMLYDNYKNDITFIEKNDVPFPFLIKYKSISSNMEDYENDPKRIKIIEEWFKNGKYVYLKEFNPEINDQKIEIFYLTDIALFSYLLLSSLNNYFLEKDTKQKTKEAKYKQKFEQKYKDFLYNNISFNTFTSIQNNKLNDFLDLINFYMYNFEIGSARLKLIENSRIVYNTSNNKQKFKYVKSYNCIYGLYWFILKMQIYSILNGYKIINMCSCGNMIIGKAERCPTCLKLYDTFRHNIENHAKSKEN